MRVRYHGPVIAITGSVGKTGTKEAIGSMVRKKYGAKVLITPRSFNAEVGIPLTFFGYHSTPTSLWGWFLMPLRGLFIGLVGALPDCIVLELGAEHKGDIARFSRLVKPTLAIITGITQAHTESTIGPLEVVRKEKTAMIQFLGVGGTVVVNGDDEYLAKLAVPTGITKLSVRLHERADYFASGIKVTLEGTESVLHHHNRTQRVRIKRWGDHQLYAVLFAAAVGDVLQISPTQQLGAFKEIQPVPGRGMLIQGKKGSLLFDDTYNASPLAMKAAIKVLCDLPGQKKVAILGDMRELKDAEIAHQEIGKLARAEADYVIAVGPQSKAYKANEWFMTADEAIESALRQAGPGVMILLKGSQNTIRLEKITKALMLHPDQASKLLVRQTKEWEQRA